MIFALVIAIAAFGLAVFGFVDRKGIEADIDSLKRLMDNFATKAEADVRAARANAFKEVSALKAEFHARVVALESKAKWLEGKIKAPFVKKSNVKKG
jgi:HAMP domain-containing protein